MIIQFLFESVESLKVTLRFNHLRLIKQFSVVLFISLSSCSCFYKEVPFPEKMCNYRNLKKNKLSVTPLPRSYHWWCSGTQLSNLFLLFLFFALVDNAPVNLVYKSSLLVYFLKIDPRKELLIQKAYDHSEVF